MKENIAHITTVHIRTDTRIFYKEVISCSKKYNTFLIVADGKGNDKREGVKILDLGKPKNRFLRVLIYGLKALPIIIKNKIKVVHFHDPELIPIGLILKLFGYKVIYDIHELVYEDLKTKSWISSKFIREILAFFYSKMEYIGLKFFDGIILAEDGYKNFYEKHYSKSSSKFIYVRNFPKTEMFKTDSHDYLEPRNLDSKINLIYLGAISRDRGILEVIDSLSYLDDRFNLKIIGKWNDQNFLEECKQSSGWPKVNPMGYIKPSDIGKEILKSHVGLCTLHKIENFAYTTPVKSFEYLACGVPIIMTDFPFWKKFYSECALFVDPKKPEQIASQIIKMISDKNNYYKLSKNGQELSVQNTWKEEEKKLMNLYEILSL